MNGTSAPLNALTGPATVHFLMFLCTQMYVPISALNRVDTVRLVTYIRHKNWSSLPCIFRSSRSAYSSRFVQWLADSNNCVDAVISNAVFSQTRCHEFSFHAHYVYTTQPCTRVTGYLMTNELVIQDIKCLTLPLSLTLSWVHWLIVQTSPHQLHCIVSMAKNDGFNLGRTVDIKRWLTAYRKFIAYWVLRYNN